MDRREYGCCFEILWGRAQRSRLDAPRSMAEDGQKQTYVYGSALNLAHVALIMQCGAPMRDELCGLSCKILSNRDHISKIMGMDGIVLDLDANDRPLRVARIDEAKTTSSRNALFGTYMLSENLHEKRIKQSFAIVHPSDTKINQPVLERMRVNHGHSVGEIRFDPPLDEVRTVRDEVFPAPPSMASPASSESRRWQIEQMQVLKPLLHDIGTSNVGAFGTILRLDAYMSSGKSRAIAMIMRSAMKTFGLRVVSAHTVSGLQHMMRELVSLGVEVEECDYKTSRAHDGDETSELRDERSIRKIAQMIKAHASCVTNADAPRPPVLGCLHHTLPILCRIVNPLLNVANRMLYVQDESQECRSAEVIDELIANPNIVTIQVSGTFYDSDMALVDAHPRWCVKPYYQYTYKSSIRDGHSVPLDVYLYSCTENTPDARTEKLIDILCLYPGTTIVATRSIQEARSMRQSVSAASLGYRRVACVHSDMQAKHAALDDGSSPEQVIDWVKAHPTEPAVIITVLMARSSIDIPSAKNFVDFRSSAPTIDRLRQTQGRVLRAFSCVADDGSVVQKHAGRYFVEDAHRDIVQYSRRLFDETDITIYDMHGDTLEDMIRTSMPMRPCAGMTSRVAALKQQRREYRFAFAALAYEAIQHVVTKSDRNKLKAGTRWIRVPFLSASVTADLRSVVDDIVRLYNHTSSGHLALPDDFVFPPFAVDAQQGRKDRNVIFPHFTPEQRLRLKKECSLPITDDVWSAIRRATRDSSYRKLEQLWQFGCIELNGKRVETPKLHKCDMSVDVDDVCATELRDTIDGVFEKKDYIRWTLQRLKLPQMKLLGHPQHDRIAREESERIDRSKKSGVGRKRRQTDDDDGGNKRARASPVRRRAPPARGRGKELDEMAGEKEEEQREEDDDDDDA